jgi:hypothetical protein
MLALFPLWWAMGLGEMAWIPLAACMAILMARRGGIRVPRGFGIWLTFLALMCASVIGIDTPGRLIGFIYRVLLYLSVAVVFVYIYNARETLTARYVLGVLTLFWFWAVIGGFAGLLAPEFSFRTPMSYVLPRSLTSNEAIGEMAIRRLTQYNPDSWFDIEPRPSAPFLYTNGWGNVYSITLPTTIAYLTLIPRRLKFWLILLACALSLIPAFLTLNRGMFIGLGVAAAYLLIRFALAGRWQHCLVLVALSAVAGVAMIVMDVGAKLSQRLDESSSTRDRANLYSETLTRSLQSPLFGYGAPRPSTIAGAPSVGTQGQVWTVMFSNGFPALVLFMAALAWMFIATLRGLSTASMILNTVQLVILVESFFYGVLLDGLILTITTPALSMRRGEPRRRSPREHKGSG